MLDWLILRSSFWRSAWTSVEFFIVSPGAAVVVEVVASVLGLASCFTIFTNSSAKKSEGISVLVSGVELDVSSAVFTFDTVQEGFVDRQLNIGEYIIHIWLFRFGRWQTWRAGDACFCAVRPRILAANLTSHTLNTTSPNAYVAGARHATL